MRSSISVLSGFFVPVSLCQAKCLRSHANGILEKGSRGKYERKLPVSSDWEINVQEMHMMVARHLLRLRVVEETSTVACRYL